MSVSHRNRNPPGSEPPLGLSVVIATLDRPENLTETIASVAACIPLPDEIVIVDGHEGFSARAVAATWNRPDAGLSVRYLASPTGLTRQRNTGLAVARSGIVLFLDDDVTIPPHTTATILAAYEDPDVAGVTGRVVGDRSQLVNRESRLRRFLPGGGREGSFTRFGYPRYIARVTEPHDVEYMHGCFMSARRDLATEVGFDERLTGYALAEDEDFSYRLSQRGRIRYLPAIVVEHRLAPHTGSASRALSRMLVVNRAYLFRKNFAPTLAARAQFALLVVLLVVHRIAARNLAGARGIVEGATAALRGGGGFPTEAPNAKRMTTQPIPVAFVSSHARDGGAERHLERVVEAIDPRWVAVVVSLEDGPLPRRAAELGHRTVVIETGNRRRDLVVAAMRLRRALTAVRPRVVCASGIKAAAVAGLATLGLGIPVVWLKVDFSFDGRTARLVARRCAIVAGVSQAVLATFPRQLAPKLRVVYNGVPDVRVDRRRGRGRIQQSFGEAPPERIVGLVGRLDPSKGHRHLIESAPAIIARAPGTGFLLVGGANPDSDYARALQALARDLGVENAVRFVAHTDDVAEIMAGLDLLVHASVRPPGYIDTEGFPLVALEAMLAGVPVVGYGNGGLPELVGTTGRIVRPGDRQALAESIVELLTNDELRADLGARARARVRSSFLLPASIGTLEACLREATG